MVAMNLRFGLVAVTNLFLAGVVLGGSNEAGIKFLAENAKKDGVVVLPSGMQYKVLKTGDGAFHPTKSTTCSCHYHGSLVDGTVFDSSVDRGQPTDFAPNQVIAGWTEAMPMMVEGDKWELYIPSDLAYGDRGSPPKIQGGDTLIFTIEIMEIKGDKVPAVKCDPATKDGCDDKESKYIDKQASKSSDDLKKEMKRLTSMDLKSIKAELVEWITRRVIILGKMLAKEEL